jgi:hypothetical protein
MFRQLSCRRRLSAICFRKLRLGHDASALRRCGSFSKPCLLDSFRALVDQPCLFFLCGLGLVGRFDACRFRYKLFALCFGKIGIKSLWLLVYEGIPSWPSADSFGQFIVTPHRGILIDGR